jgi:hypothetical protein
VRLDAQLDVVADGSQVQVTFERFEGGLDFGQLHIQLPKRARLVASAKATQQVMSVALLGLLEFVFQQLELKGVPVDRLTRLGSSSTVRTLPDDKFSKNAGFFMRVSRPISKCSAKF